MKDENKLENILSMVRNIKSEVDEIQKPKTEITPNTFQDHRVNFFFEGMNLVGDSLKIRNVTLECEDEKKVILTIQENGMGIIVLNKGIIDNSLIADVVESIKLVAGKYEIGIEEKEI
ncbi:MAG: hypothetical protein LCH52_08410 [Bacteroidetes bacterium]|nr:hypothetical protein [Bacteroidota bacterium]